jgi:hypothetical protein
MAFRTTAATCALGLLLALPAAAQGSGDDVRQEIEALKKGQQEIQKQLAEIKALLQARGGRGSAGSPPAGARRQGQGVRPGRQPDPRQGHGQAHADRVQRLPVRILRPVHA